MERLGRLREIYRFDISYRKEDVFYNRFMRFLCLFRVVTVVLFVRFGVVCFRFWRGGGRGGG